MYYMCEVVPFWKLHNMDYINKSYWEIYNFLQKIYQNPTVNITDDKGKVVGR